jgi:hypothetical protein
MTPDKYAALASMALGAIGTMILFLNSYTLEPPAGAALGSPESVKQNEGIMAKNASRTRWQRVGFAILCASFIVQAMSISF